MGVYYGNKKLTGAGFQIDTGLSATSLHPIANAAVTNALYEAGYPEWEKPADWIDIRSGAQDNSIYVLVAHSKPSESAGVYSITTYPTFYFRAYITDSGTCDVYVDGEKLGSYESGVVSYLDWEALYTSGKISSGYDITHPSELTTHIVRFTPTNPEHHITGWGNRPQSPVNNQGVLWAHYELSNPIGIYSALGAESRPHNPLMEAITAKDNLITYTVSSSGAASGPYGFCSNAPDLKTIPVLKAENQSYAASFFHSFYENGLRKIVIKNNTGSENLQILTRCNAISVEVENGLRCQSGLVNSNQVTASNLKKLPTLNFDDTCDTVKFVNLNKLEPTVFDDSKATKRQNFTFCGGSASNFVSGLKGLVVSNEAPFNSSTYPQLNVNYTGLNRANLVRLFKSMPYNNGYEVAGNPTITDGIASGFSASDTITSKLAFPNAQAVNGCAWQVKFTTPATAPGSNGARLLGMYFGNVADAVGFSQSMHPFWRLNGSSAAITTETEMQLSTTYFMSGYIANGVAHLLLGTSEDNQIEIGSLELPELTIGTARRLFIGTTTIPNVPYTGTIDLNYTWVKMGGVYWYRGAEAAMTKTCSVVGCTGTADLTADDKAIAEDKGWELVLS